MSISYTISSNLIAEFLEQNDFALVHRTESGVTTTHAVKDGLSPADSDIAGQLLIDSFTVAQAQDQLKLKLRIKVAEQYNDGIEGAYGYAPSPHETNGWLAKETEAVAYQAWVDAGSNGKAPDTKKINSRITKNNTLAKEADSIIAKAGALHTLEDAINAWAQSKKDLINAAITFDDLAAIDLYSGAPS